MEKNHFVNNWEQKRFAANMENMFLEPRLQRIRHQFTLGLVCSSVVYLILILLRHPAEEQYYEIVMNGLFAASCAYFILDRFPSSFPNVACSILILLSSVHWGAVVIGKIARRFSSKEELNRLWQERLDEREWAQIMGRKLIVPDRIVTMASVLFCGLLLLIFLWCYVRMYKARKQFREMVEEGPALAIAS